MCAWSTIGGGRAEIVHRGRTLTVPVSFEQRHNGVNLAAAVAACDALGVDIDVPLLEGAALAEISRWRGERLPLPGGGVLDRGLLQREPGLDERRAARPRRGRRRPADVAVLGDMAELGEERRGLPRGGCAARPPTSGSTRSSRSARSAGAYGGTWYPTLEDALAAVPGAIRPGDAVLVKASRAMGLEAVVEAVTA